MNEELQKELVAWLSKLRETVDAGASFAVEQAPLIVQEKLLYGRVLYTSSLILAVLAFLVAAYVFYRGLTYKPEEQETDGYRYRIDDTGASICIWSGVPGLALGMSILMLTDRVVQVWFAPRIYIVEWIARLMK